MAKGRLSGLQRDVIHLYRNCLRQIGMKPLEHQQNFRDFARREFEKNLSLDKKDFSTIEFLLRKGQRQLDIYSAPGVTNILSMMFRLLFLQLYCLLDAWYKIEPTEDCGQARDVD